MVRGWVTLASDDTHASGQGGTLPKGSSPQLWSPIRSSSVDGHIGVIQNAKRWRCYLITVG